MTENLQINGKLVTWKHIKELYARCRATADRSGLSLLPKLKLEHVELTSYSRMRVDLAAEVSLCFLPVYASAHFFRF